MNMRKAYVLDSDIENCYEDNVFLAVKARPGTRLEVPVVNNNVSNHINLNPYAVTVEPYIPVKQCVAQLESVQQMIQRLFEAITVYSFLTRS